MSNSIDYEKDARSFSDCLKDFAVLINGGKEYGARGVAAKELRIQPSTLAGWMDGRPCGHEAAMRRLMTLIVEKSVVKRRFRNPALDTDIGP